MGYNLGEADMPIAQSSGPHGASEQHDWCGEKMTDDKPENDEEAPPFVRREGLPPFVQNAIRAI